MNSNDFANMIFGMLSIVIGLSALFVIFYTNSRYKYNKDKKK